MSNKLCLILVIGFVIGNTISNICVQVQFNKKITMLKRDMEYKTETTVKSCYEPIPKEISVHSFDIGKIKFFDIDKNRAIMRVELQMYPSESEPRCKFYYILNRLNDDKAEKLIDKALTK